MFVICFLQRCCFEYNEGSFTFWNLCPTYPSGPWQGPRSSFGHLSTIYRPRHRIISWWCLGLHLSQENLCYLKRYRKNWWWRRFLFKRLMLDLLNLRLMFLSLSWMRNLPKSIYPKPPTSNNRSIVKMVSSTYIFTEWNGVWHNMHI